MFLLASLLSFVAKIDDTLMSVKYEASDSSWLA